MEQEIKQKKWIDNIDHNMMFLWHISIWNTNIAPAPHTHRAEPYQQLKLFTDSALWSGAAEYADCMSAEEYSSSNEWPGYDTKQSGGEAPVLGLWEMWSTSSLPLLPGPLWLEMVVPLMVPSKGQI